MVLVQALSVVGQSFDDPALGDRSPFVLLDHPLEFEFQRIYPNDSALDSLKLRTCDPVRRLTGPVGVVREAQERSDSIQWKPQFPAVPDKGQPRHVTWSISPLITGRAKRGRGIRPISWQ